MSKNSLESNDISKRIDIIISSIRRRNKMLWGMSILWLTSIIFMSLALYYSTERLQSKTRNIEKNIEYQAQKAEELNYIQINNIENIKRDFNHLAKLFTSYFIVDKIEISISQGGIESGLEIAKEISNEQLKTLEKIIENGVVKRTLEQKNILKSIIYGIKDYKKGIEYLSQCIENNTKTTYTKKSDIYKPRGLFYFYLEEYEQALKDLDMAISLDSRNGMAHHLRGFVKMLQGDSSEAVKSFKKASEYRPPLEGKVGSLENMVVSLNSVYERATK